MEVVSRHISIAVIGFGLLLFADVGFAATGSGVSGADFLRIKAGPRASALGGAYVALADDGYGMYWNPAGMSRLKRGTFSATHQEQVFEVFNELVGVTMPFSYNHTWGVASRVTWDQQNFRTELETGSEFTNTDISLGLNYAYGGQTGLAWGVGVKGIRSKKADFTAHSFAVDMGIHYQSPRTPLKLGAVVQNLGPDIKFIEEGDPLPRTIRTGWAYDFYPWNRRLTISNDLVYFQPENQTNIAIGSEFEPFSFLTLRGGYTSPEGFESDGRFSGGLGIRWGNWLIDYGYTQRETLEAQHRFSMTLLMGSRPDPAGPFGVPSDSLGSTKSIQSDDQKQDSHQSPRYIRGPKLRTRGSVEYLNKKAQKMFLAENYKRSIRLWRQSLKLQPSQRDLYRKISIAYYEMGDYERAQKYQDLASEKGIRR